MLHARGVRVCYSEITCLKKKCPTFCRRLGKQFKATDPIGLCCSPLFVELGREMLSNLLFMSEHENRRKLPILSQIVRNCDN